MYKNNNCFQLNSFYYNEDEEYLNSQGYIRSVVYRFRQGDGDPNQANMNFVYVTVEHYFRSDSNITFQDFTKWHKDKLKENQGKLSETFAVAPSSSVASTFES